MKIIYSYNRSYFKLIDSEDKAYFMGLLYADGQNHQKGNFVRLSLQESDRHILENFIECIEGNNVLGFLNRKSKNHSNQYYLQLNSKEICNDLFELGCGQNKTKILRYPTDIQLPKYLTNHFIRGYFDGDGSVWEGKRKLCLIKDKHHSKGERIRIIHNVKFNLTGTIAMMLGIQNVLVTELGFKQNKINTSKNIRNCVQLEYSGRKQMKKFYDFIYEDSKSYFFRKKEKFETIIFGDYER